MSKITLKDENNIYQIDLEGIDDFDNWNIIEDESYTLPKSEFVEGKFKETFPDLNLQYSQITSLSARNKRVKEFLAIANLEFISAVKIPKSLTNIVTAEEFKDIEIRTKKFNSHLAAEAAEIQSAAEAFKNKRLEIEKKYSTLKEKETSNPIVKILTLTVDDLPISLSLMIENYSPSDETAPNARRYGRELLLRYQKMLIKTLKDNKDLQINQLLDKLSAK